MTMTEVPPAVPGADQASVAAPADQGATAAAGKKGKKGKGKKGEPKGRSNLLPALVLAGGIAAGGYFMGGGSATPADATATTVAAVEPGEIAVLDPLTVNLAGGRYLRVGVSILTAKDFEVLHGDVHKGEPSRFAPEHENRMRDQVIALFSGRQLSDVVGGEQLDEAKDELLERANEVLEGKALEVYFTEFVTQ